MDNNYKMIKEECLKSETINPFELLMHIMDQDFIKMHGPEHHILDGSVLLSVLHNVGLKFDLNNALDEMIIRGSKMPGATCGQWGICGSASSLGAALAIIHNTGPLSNNQHYKNNLLFTSIALNKIGNIGGPRCCKRNAFLSMQTAVKFIEENYSIKLGNETIKCHYSPLNPTCLKNKCPFWSKM